MKENKIYNKLKKELSKYIIDKYGYTNNLFVRNEKNILRSGDIINEIVIGYGYYSSLDGNMYMIHQTYNNRLTEKEICDDFIKEFYKLYPKQKSEKFRNELTKLIDKYTKENDIYSEYLLSSIETFNKFYKK